jgi:hypothetical protein
MPVPTCLQKGGAFSSAASRFTWLPPRLPGRNHDHRRTLKRRSKPVTSMFRFTRRNSEKIAEAQNLASLQLANLRHQRKDISEEEAMSFLAREVLRLYREGERDPQRLANQAVSLYRQHIQKRESAVRLAKSDL